MPDEIQNTPVTSATNSAPPVVNNRNNATIDTPPTEQNRIPVNNTAATINTFNYNGSMFNQQHDATYNRQSGAIRGAEQDLKYLIAIIILMVSIFVIVLGAMNKVVIYMDSTDLGLNIIPLPLIFLGIGIGELMNILIFKVIIDAVAISAAVAVAAYNFRNSLRFNSFLSTTYNIIVATAKLSFSIIAICLSVIWVGDVLDKKDVARAVKSAALLGLMAALVSKLINGKAVYLARGLSVVPDQVDSEEPDHSPIAG